MFKTGDRVRRKVTYVWRDKKYEKGWSGTYYRQDVEGPSRVVYDNGEVQPNPYLENLEKLLSEPYNPDQENEDDCL